MYPTSPAFLTAPAWGLLFYRFLAFSGVFSQFFNMAEHAVCQWVVRLSSMFAETFFAESEKSACMHLGAVLLYVHFLRLGR